MANTYPWPANGNVGIGTANPIATLDVRGVNMLTDAHGQYNSHFPYDDNNVYVTGQKIILRGGVPQGWKTALTVDGASGNVGIGTAMPVEKLHVVSATLAILGEGGAGIGVNGKSTNGVGVLGESGAGTGVNGKTDNGTGVRGESDGGIAIHGVNPRGLAGRFDGDVGINGQIAATSGGIAIHGISPGGFAGKFDGNVEISGELHVAGAIFCGGILMNVPDHVFEPDYPLLSLDEVRAYLAEEKHLPNVPSAKTIQQEGLNMSEFQMKLLEKIEELTLYTLAQDEQLKVHQAKIELLEQRFRAVG